MDRIKLLSQVSVIVIGAVALFAALDLAESIFAPLALALVAGVVLSPLSDFWEQRGYSSLIGALVGLGLTLSALAGLALIFQPVIAQLVEQAPKVWSDMQETVATVRGLVRGWSQVSDDVSRAIATEAGAVSKASGSDSVAMPTVTDAVMAAPAVLSQVLIFVGGLFFFLLTRREIYDWAALHLSSRGEHLQTAHKLRSAERQVSRYFVTITLINAGLGAATAVLLQAIGMPSAILWGVVGFLLNFVVYLGPVMFIVALLFAGVAAFDGGMSLIPAAIFVTLNSIESQFVTPALIGRRLAVNALLVFLALIFWIWLWGPIGGIVAIPLLLWFLVLCDMLKPADPVPEATEVIAE